MCVCVCECVWVCVGVWVCTVCVWHMYIHTHVPVPICPHAHPIPSGTSMTSRELLLQFSLMRTWHKIRSEDVSFPDTSCMGYCLRVCV